MKTFVTVAGLLAGSLLCGQQRPPAASPLVKDPAAGSSALAMLRAARLDGDYAVRFNLTHTPGFKSDSEEVSYSGELYGTWRGDGPRSLVRLRPAGGGPVLVSLLTQGGTSPGTWRWKSGDSTPAGTPVTWGQLLEPLAPSLQFSAFELQTPFLFWSDYEYEGKSLEGRHEHHFRMKPPAGFSAAHPSVQAVRVYVDDEFFGARKWEVLGDKSKVLRVSEMRSFKKIDDRYMVMKVDFADLVSDGKTRFEATAAALGLRLPQPFFEPERLGDARHPVDPAALKGL